MGEGNSGLFTWRAQPLPREDNYKIAKIHWWNLKIFFSRTIRSISTKPYIKHPWVKSTLGFINKDHLIMKKGDDWFFHLQITETLWYNHSSEQICLLMWTGFFRWAMWQGIWASCFYETCIYTTDYMYQYQYWIISNFTCIF